MNFIVFFPIGLLVGYFLPGYFLAKILTNRLVLISSFLISTLVLFHSIFYLGLLGIPLRFSTVAVVLIFWTLIAFYISRRIQIPLWKGQKEAHIFSSTLPSNRLMIFGMMVICFIFMVRYLFLPLTGFDTSFRWDLLAQQILTQERFDFYPPLRAEDFKIYFYVDGIAPLISFCYWWIYSSAGSSAPILTSFFVFLQFFFTLFLCFETGKYLHSERLGVVSVVLLLTSGLFFHSLFIGQESGMIALSTIATVYFIFRSAKEDEFRLLILAAVASSLGALAREYGWALVFFGLMLGIVEKIQIKRMMAYVVLCLAFAFPWYLRNWILTGNPFFDNPIGDLFPGNDIHVAYLQEINRTMGIQSFEWADYLRYLKWMVEYGTLPLIFGLVGGLRFWRDRKMLLIGGVLFIVICFASIGYSAGTAIFSLRVLMPTLILFSLLGAMVLDSLMERKKLTQSMSLILSFTLFIAAFHHLFLPSHPFQVPPRKWLNSILHFRYFYNSPYIGKAPILKHFPAPNRILSNSVYAFASLNTEGVEVVPVWSPEVSFLFDENVPVAEIRKRLLEKKIHGMYLALDPFYHFLKQHAFFYYNPKEWNIVWQQDNLILRSFEN